MQCAHCATPVPETARYCHNCGSVVSDAEGQAAATAAMDDSAVRHMERLLREDTRGEFEILRQIGRGGMAAVYLAHEVHLDRNVAIKVLPPELTFGHGVERFKREAKTAAALDHINIIPIYRIASGGKIFWYAMKFLEGRSLDAHIRAAGQLSLDETIKILQAVANALDYAHQHEVVHRDVKPANVMLDARERVVVTDFGIAKPLTETTLTASGSLVGTPYYMSPEQGMGKPVTGAADQYSVAVMTYHMLTGRVPFEGDSAIEVLHKHCTAAPPPMDSLRPGLPAHVYAAVKKSLEKKADQRFDSVTAFVDALIRPAPGLVVAPTVAETPTTIIPADQTTAPLPQPTRESTRGPVKPVPPAPTAPSTAADATTPMPVAPSDPSIAADATTPMPVAPSDPSIAADATTPMPVAPSDPSIAAGTTTPMPVGRGADSSYAEPTTPIPTPPPPVTRHPRSGTPPPPERRRRPVVMLLTVAGVLAAATIGVVAVRPWGGGEEQTTTPASANPLDAGIPPAEMGVVDDAGTSDAEPTDAAPTPTDRASAPSETPTETVATPPPTQRTPPSRQPAAPPGVDVVAIRANATTMIEGQTQTLGLQVRDAGGRTLTDRRARWEARNTSVATVRADGRVSARGPGRTYVVATVEQRRDSVLLTVTAQLVDVVIRQRDTTLAVGQSVQFVGQALGTRGPLTDRRIAWSSSDPTVVSVDGNGRVTARAVGRAAVIAQSETRADTVTVTARARPQPAAPVATPPPAAPPAPPVEEQIQALVTRYVQRLQAKDVQTIDGLYPAVDAQDQRFLRDLTNLMTDADRDLQARGPTSVEPRIEGDAAVARFGVTLSYRNAFGARRSREVHFIAQFRQAGNLWQLVACKLDPRSRL